MMLLIVNEETLFQDYFFMDLKSSLRDPKVVYSWLFLISYLLVLTMQFLTIGEKKRGVFNILMRALVVTVK